MLSDNEQAKQFAVQGREVVHQKYSNGRLAKELVENILAPLVTTKLKEKIIMASEYSIFRRVEFSETDLPALCILPIIIAGWRSASMSSSAVLGYPWIWKMRMDALDGPGSKLPAGSKDP